MTTIYSKKNDNFSEKMLSYICDKKWEDLKISENVNCAFCSTCNKNVFMVFSKEQYKLNADKGNCVCISQKASIELLGDISYSDNPIGTPHVSMQLCG